MVSTFWVTKPLDRMPCIPLGLTLAHIDLQLKCEFLIRWIASNGGSSDEVAENGIKVHRGITAGYLHAEITFSFLFFLSRYFLYFLCDVHCIFNKNNFFKNNQPHFGSRLRRITSNEAQIQDQICF